jgi:hypothetical protein
VQPERAAKGFAIVAETWCDYASISIGRAMKRLNRIDVSRQSFRDILNTPGHLVKEVSQNVSEESTR